MSWLGRLCGLVNAGGSDLQVLQERGLEDGQLLVSLETPEALDGLEHARCGPAQGHLRVTPPLHVPTDLTDWLKPQAEDRGRVVGMVRPVNAGTAAPRSPGGSLTRRLAGTTSLPICRGQRGRRGLAIPGVGPRLAVVSPFRPSATGWTGVASGRRGTTSRNGASSLHTNLSLRSPAVSFLFIFGPPCLFPKTPTPRMNHSAGLVHRSEHMPPLPQGPAVLRLLPWLRVRGSEARGRRRSVGGRACSSRCSHSARPAARRCRCVGSVSPRVRSLGPRSCIANHVSYTDRICDWLWGLHGERDR